MFTSRLTTVRITHRCHVVTDRSMQCTCNCIRKQFSYICATGKLHHMKVPITEQLRFEVRGICLYSINVWIPVNTQHKIYNKKEIVKAFNQCKMIYKITKFKPFLLYTNANCNLQLNSHIAICAFFACSPNQMPIKCMFYNVLQHFSAKAMNIMNLEKYSMHFTLYGRCWMQCIIDNCKVYVWTCKWNLLKG